MKRTQLVGFVVAALSILGTTTSSFSQTLKDFFSNSESPVVYLGIDFSKAKLLDAGNPSDIRDRTYPAINQLILNEPKKYDLSAAFLKSKMESDLGPVTKSNSSANLNEILSTNSADYSRFKEADISAIIKGLDLSGKKGIGLLFVMESMSKINKAAAMWVTIIDIKTKKVLLTERMEGKAVGFSVRNYWAGTVKSVLDAIEKQKYKEWKLKYGS